MSASKDPRRHTAKWLSAFEWMMKNPNQDLVLTADSEKSAMALRFEFYRAREAFTRSVEHDGDPLGLAELIPNLNKRVATLDGRQVKLLCRDQGKVATALRDALLAKGVKEDEIY